jgi:hypothetical protein
MARTNNAARSTWVVSGLGVAVNKRKVSVFALILIEPTCGEETIFMDKRPTFI